LAKFTEGWFKKVPKTPTTTKANELSIPTIVQQPFSPKTPIPSMNAEVWPTSTQQAVGASTDSGIMNQILEDLDKADLPGPDMLEFKKNFESMLQLPMPDNVRVEAVLKMLVANSKIPRENLLNQIKTSVPHYLERIENTKKELTALLDQQAQTDIKARELQVESIRKNLDATQAEIQAKQMEMGNMRTQMADLQQKISEAQVELNYNQSTLQTTIESVKATFNNYLLKLQGII
jgi:hypothetical protein